MCEDLEFEHGALPDHCDTPESRAVWRRAEAFAISQPVAEKLADLVETLARMAMIIDAEVAASSSWARVELETWLNRVRGMPPTTSRAELKLLDAEALSFFLSDPKLHAAYDAASSMETWEVIAAQLEVLRVQAEQHRLSDDERRHMALLEELRAMLDEEVRNGRSRLRSLD